MAITSKSINKKHRIFIVDDHPLMREGLKARIEAQDDMVVCGEADDGPDAVEQLDSAQPDLLIVDLALKTTHGLELVKALKSRFKILIVTAYDEALYAERALRAGALGYVNKQEAQEKIIDAVREVLAGRHYLSHQATQRLLAAVSGNRSGGNLDDPVKCLTDRELQVFELIGQGKSTSAIAKQLRLSVHTIDSHRENIRHKMQLANGSELTQRAVQWVLENV